MSFANFSKTALVSRTSGGARPPGAGRSLPRSSSLAQAAKCALVSMDSTMKSNLSVGPPLDLVVYEANRFETDKVICVDMSNPYYRMLHSSWGQKLREVFDITPVSSIVTGDGASA